MAATAYNLKKLLKFAKTPPKRVAQSDGLTTHRSPPNYFRPISRTQFFLENQITKKPAKGFYSIRYFDLSAVVQRLPLLYAVL